MDGLQVLEKTESLLLHGIEPRYYSSPARDPVTTLDDVHRPVQGLTCAGFVVSTEELLRTPSSGK